ncbi:MAG: UDP-N-acetylmuramoyl-tripeptide--D-alanyl-D-alanine ligase [Syntrophales bacterium]|nr:UDP-N-acetylmuramoyl-tripeptide--D-alanyl-D-alanine ligase [Syntrophales bacterium]
MKLTAKDITRATGGYIVRGSADVEFSGVSTDSRTVNREELFICLIGERFDGHDFAENALQKGAKGVLVSRHISLNKSYDATIISVKDTLKALGDIATFVRDRFSGPVVAITGSSGKTTTKEIIAAVFSQLGPTLRTEKNFNNLVGLPLTLLRLEGRHVAAVLEMGTNSPGEIRRLTEIALPTVGVVTNIGPAHLEGLKSIEGVFEEKVDLFRYMPGGGTVVLNVDDAFLRRYVCGSKHRCITFSIRYNADVSASDITLGEEGICFTLNVREVTDRVFLRLIGQHQLGNALAATAAALAAGVPFDCIKKGLETVRPISGRMNVLKLLNGAFVLDDTYNANPSSVREAIHTLAELNKNGRSIVVLGDMLELGKDAPLWHRKIGSLLAEVGVDGLFLKGEFAGELAMGALSYGFDGKKIHIVEDNRELAERCAAILSDGDWVLVKGSRRTKMEEVVAKIVEIVGLKEDKEGRV